MKKLFALRIPNLPVGQYPDSLTPGLILRVGKNRCKWECRYRKGGKRYADRLGYFPAMGLAEAREAASTLLKRIDAGQSPVTAIVHPQSASVLTLGKLVDRYEAMRRKEGRNTRTLDNAMRTVRYSIADYLSVPAAQFSKADLRAARDKIAERLAPIAGAPGVYSPSAAHHPPHRSPCSMLARS